MRHRLEYVPVRILVFVLGVLPLPVSRRLGRTLASLLRLLHRRLTRAGMRNLEIAFPEKSPAERGQVLRAVFAGLGNQLAEFCHFPDYTRENIESLAVCDGLANYEAARARGKGVLFLTAHLGGWEIGSFAYSLMGNPLCIVARGLDNPYVARLVNARRTLHGNRVFDKDDYARGLLAAMRAGETVGILMDTNMTPPQGVFVDFFGQPACTASGLARLAQHTEAAVVPAFTLWDAALGRYRIATAPALELVRTSDAEADILANTALFTRTIESYVRRHPEQWLWIHRRWKTRPAGEPSLY